ncbi:hypothetical protein N0V88_000114 [Collariella sp. IMI 366227]|nr:hypothetical protein N0V88_000114 [Collariella sp. IMI 366227]
MPKPFKSRIIVPYKHIQPPTDPIPEHEKAAFITHMNTNWRLELRHLVVLHPTSTGIPEEYNSPARRNEEDPLLTDINYRGMTLYLPSTDSTHIVPFSPPLRSWADRRTRVADMAARARESMDIWEDGTVGLVVEEYAKPRVPYDAVGAMAFKRFDIIVERMRVEREKKW